MSTSPLSFLGMTSLGTCIHDELMALPHVEDVSMCASLEPDQPHVVAVTIMVQCFGDDDVICHTFALELPESALTTDTVKDFHREVIPFQVQILKQIVLCGASSIDWGDFGCV